MELHTLLIETAKSEGFPLAGSVDIDLAYSHVPAKPESSIQSHIEKYDEWIQSGFAGSMDYLVRGRDRRADPRLLFPEARSIFCVALPYSKNQAGSKNPIEGPRYARYLQGRDYHCDMAEKLERVMKKVSENFDSSPIEGPLRWKVCVDTSAILEKSWASLAGLGWIGKNSLLIHPQYGSYLFLGEVLLNQATGRSPSPLPNYCGNCSRCMDACPTKAFSQPRLLDSNRCISYWTLEKRGKLPISSDDKKKIGPWVAGCDICQEVCPFNRKPTQTAETNLALEGLATDLNQWRDLISEDQASYRNRVRGSALNRVKPVQFSRNLAISLANCLEQATESEFKSMMQWLEPVISKRIHQPRGILEGDEVAHEEWKTCLSIIQTRNQI